METEHGAEVDASATPAPTVGPTSPADPLPAEDEAEPVDAIPTVPADFNPAPEQRADDPDPTKGPPIEDPTGSMKPFYAALARTAAEEPGAITRILHMGDSSIGLDGLPHAIRTRMMDAFGDAGPGWVLIDRPSPNTLSHVADASGEGWQVCYIAYGCQPDGHYGLGGHVFRGSQRARAQVRSAKAGELGSSVTMLELWYAEQRGGGRFKVRVDNDDWKAVDTRSDVLADQWVRFDVSAGRHRLAVRGAGGGRFRIFGAVLENDGPGVVWDTASMIGAFTKRLDGYDAQHIAAQIEHRNPDLIVLNYGGNDLRRVVMGRLDGDTYKEEYRKVLRKLRADTERACLIVSVIDHGRSGSMTVLPQHVATLVSAQREVAYEEGCAFFDTVAAMGGRGALRRWLRKSPRLAEPDLKHLNHRGRDLMGDMMFRAIMAGYEASRGGSGSSRAPK